MILEHPREQQQQARRRGAGTPRANLSEQRVDPLAGGANA